MKNRIIFLIILTGLFVKVNAQILAPGIAPDNANDLRANIPYVCNEYRKYVITAYGTCQDGQQTGHLWYQISLPASNTDLSAILVDGVSHGKSYLTQSNIFSIYWQIPNSTISELITVTPVCKYDGPPAYSKSGPASTFTVFNGMAPLPIPLISNPTNGGIVLCGDTPFSFNIGNYGINELSRIDGFKVTAAGCLINGATSPSTIYRNTNTITITPPSTSCMPITITTQAFNSCEVYSTVSTQEFLRKLSKPNSITMTPNDGDPNVCCGSTTPRTFSINAVPFASNYNWRSTWSSANGRITSSPQLANVIPINDVGGAINVVALSNNPGVNPSDVSDDYIITRLPSPSALPITSTKSTLCVGSTTNLSVLAPCSGSNVNWTYNWQLPASLMILSGQGTSQIIAKCVNSINGPVTASVQAVTPCGSSSFSNITLYEGLPPTPQLFAKSARSGRGGGIGVFFVTSYYPYGNISYIWHSSGQLISSTATSATFMFPANQSSGFASVSSKNDCGVSENQAIADVTFLTNNSSKTDTLTTSSGNALSSELSSSSELLNEGDISTYPNPANETLNVAIGEHIPSTSSYKLISLSGIVVSRGTISGNKFQIPLNTLISGTYILQIESLLGHFYSKKIEVIK